MDQRIKTVVFWLVIVIAAMLLWNIVRADKNDRQGAEISYSQFMSDVEAGRVASVSITGTQIRGHYRDGSVVFRLTGPADPKVFLGTLQQKGVEVSFRDATIASGPMQLMGTWAPLILWAAVVFHVPTDAKAGTGPASAASQRTHQPGLGPLAGGVAKSTPPMT
ncbi:MAG: ATP-dependent metallopeptidase FtsH/Yme1/Tma family protein [Candidatus Sulfotelmatobacter sp.]